jgi:hypothetical protein
MKEKNDLDFGWPAKTEKENMKTFVGVLFAPSHFFLRHLNGQADIYNETHQWNTKNWPKLVEPFQYNSSSTSVRLCAFYTKPAVVR